MIADRLRAVRTNRNLSVRAMSSRIEKCGLKVSASAVSQYENGTTVPAAYVAAVCRAFDIAPGWLLLGEEPGSSQEGVPLLEETLRRILTLADTAHERHGLAGKDLDTYLRIGPDLFAVLDAEGVVRQVSDGWRRILGCSPEEVVGRSYELFVHPDDRPGAARALRAVVGGAGPQSDESRVACPGQPNRTVTWTVAADGDTVFVLARDVSELKASRALADTLRAAVETSGDCVVVMDAEGAITYVNPSFCRTTGFGRAEVVGKTLALLDPGTDPPSLSPALWDSVRSGQVFRGILIHRRKDGTLFYDYRTISPIADAEGQIVGFVSTGRVLTPEVAGPLVRAGVLPPLPE